MGWQGLEAEVCAGSGVHCMQDVDFVVGWDWPLGVAEGAPRVGPEAGPRTAASLLAYQRRYPEDDRLAEDRAAEVVLQARKLDDVVGEGVEAEAEA